MDKDILAHYQFVNGEIARLKRTPNRAAAATLLGYHDMMTRNFQHERQIHLFVTLFFALLMIGSWTLGVVMMLMLGGFDAVLWPLAILVVVLTVLEAFYIRYYYHLENNTEKLYSLAHQIYKLTK
jgi:hypothetical protein